MLALRELVNGLNEMIESGRLSEADIPEDFEWLRKTIEGIDLETHEDDPVIVALARRQYGSDDVEIDDDCVFSRADNGTWVNGWLWVYDDEVNEERGSSAA